MIRFVLTWLAVFLAGAFAGQQFTLWQGMRRIHSLVGFAADALSEPITGFQEFLGRAYAGDDGVTPPDPGAPSPYRESIHDRA